LMTIRAPEAWQMERGDPSIILAILSSGIDTGHLDLVQNLWRNPTPGDGICGNDVNGCNVSGARTTVWVCPTLAAGAAPDGDVSDVLGYGTALAGIADAVTNNGYAIAGMAWNVSLMPVKVAQCAGPNPAALADGIAYAVRRGARIVLLGGGLNMGSGGCAPA